MTQKQKMSLLCAILIVSCIGAETVVVKKKKISRSSGKQAEEIIQKCWDIKEQIKRSIKELITLDDAIDATITDVLDGKKATKDLECVSQKLEQCHQIVVDCSSIMHTNTK